MKYVQALLCLKAELVLDDRLLHKGNWVIGMLTRLKNTYWCILFSLLALLLFFNPMVSGYSIPDIEQTQVVFPVNEEFDLSSTQTLSYQFPLWLDWIGSDARIRIQGGILVGRTPTSLEVITVLDDVSSQHLFEHKHGLQNSYSFHSESEYVFWIHPPNHPQVEGLKSLHNLTMELKFSFSITPEGTGVIKNIIFETFTPFVLGETDYTPIIPLQEQFSWQITQWSFGSLFFSTPLLVPLAKTHNVRLSANVEFSGLTLDGWSLTLEQGNKTLHTRDNSKLEGTLEIDPLTPCVLNVIADPPQVSELETVSVNVEIQGLVLPSLGETSSNSNHSDLIGKQLTEVLLLSQIGMILIPLLIYYRRRLILLSISQGG
ncbi:MAG: hypothetical protein ACFFCZ_25915 [Promethearchaeota archaeon]